MSRNQKLLSGFGIAAVLGGILWLSTGTSQAGESCQGLDTALRNNLNFIDGQLRSPDAQSAARIANRQAVVDLIQQRRRAAGCTANVTADQPGGAAQPPAAAPPAAKPPAAAPPTDAPPAGGAETVCRGSTVTLSGEPGRVDVPAASSNQFPIGTRLRVTNLDNNKSVEVTVTAPSGSCVLLDNATFKRVSEPNKMLIRRALIERLG
jgi:hypothetical protein